MTGYIVTPYAGTSAQNPVEVGPGKTSALITNLTNGTSYTFSVVAVNGIGPSAESERSGAVVPRDTLFDFQEPAIVASEDATSTEVGVKFNSDSFGTVTGIRFYKAPSNTGTHIGTLWTASGTLLASATFSGESGSGWQQADFSTPVLINPETTYMAAYFAPNGHYSVTPEAFASVGLANPPLQALANGLSPDGVYAHSASSVFPTNSFNASNYWVDLDFLPSPVPGQVTHVSAVGGEGSARLTWEAPSGGGPVTSYTITPYIGSEPQAPTTVTGSPPPTGATVSGLTNGLTYTFTVQASNPNGSGTASASSNPVTPTAISPPSAPTTVTASAASSQASVSWSAPASNGGSPITGYVVTPYVGATAGKPVEVGATETSTLVKGLTNGTPYSFVVTATNVQGSGAPSAASAVVIPEDTIFDFGTPATPDSGDGHSVVLGVKFSTSVAGTVTGIRFYKTSTNIGTHVGSLWTTGGTLLASGTFTGESASGWQQLTFSSPVSITANTTYLASYFAPKGHYSDTSGGFGSSGVNNPPLSALANSVSVDGVYAYSSSNVFPTSTYKATNYWVDIDFQPSS